MLISKTVRIKWNPKNRKWYEDKRYVFTKWGDEFEVEIEDLPDGSGALICIECDNCGKELKDVEWRIFKRYVHEDGKYYCNKCATKLYGIYNGRIAKLQKSISFYQWCLNKLPLELAKWTLSRWDYELNIDENGNKLTPKDISYGSDGLNGKGYWFKCLDYPEHKSEQKRINNFVSGEICLDNITCNQCNSISITHPHLIEFLVNKEDAYKYSVGSNKKITMRCPNCHYEKKLTLNKLTNRGFSCTKCSDKISYPEKFVFNVLEQVLGQEFIPQLSKTTFKWCDKYKYDFYIDKINCICETHGIFHYEDNSDWKALLKETEENDRNKEQLAKENGVDNYVVLDCRYSDIEWIKNSVMISDLPKLLNFKESDIDWLKCHEYACISLVKVACDLWESGVKDTLIIADKLKLCRETIVRYLKQGVKLNWCDYNPKIEMGGNNNKSIICLTTGEIFNSIKEAGVNYKIDGSCISKCCKNKIKYSGRHPETGDKLVWMYYDEYIEQSINNN